MKVIGITGGVGAGKTALLAYMKEHYRCRVILADEVAHQVEEPGQACYQELVKLLGNEILNPDGTIDKKRMADKIFTGSAIFVEAALLIEGGYGEILDELWYIHAREDIRRSRLRAGRAYSDEKIDRILKEQLSEKEFRRHCGVVIDNSGSLAEACQQIDKKLGEYLCQK